MSSIELVMSEFSSNRKNCGGAILNNLDRLNPTLDGFLSIFPEALVTVYTDFDFRAREGVRVVRVKPNFDPQHSRYGWRAHDFYQAFGLLNAQADVAIAMDSDMQIVSDKFKTITKFADCFGIAIPMNPRLLVGIDGGIGVDSTYKYETDPFAGTGFAYNLTPIAFSTRHAQARQLLEKYCALILHQPGRGAVHLFSAAHELGFCPYMLPPQWCVCSSRDFDSRHLWNNAVVLHVGHVDVLPRWKKEFRRKWSRLLFQWLRGILK